MRFRVSFIYRAIVLRKRSLAVGLPLLLTCGCAEFVPGKGASYVHDETQARIGADVVQRSLTENESGIRQTVEMLLSSPLTADTAVRIALLNNPDLQAAFEALDVTQAELVSSALPPIPHFEGDVRFASGTSPAFELQFLQNFVGALLSPMRRRMNDSLFESAKLQLIHEVLSLAFDVRRQFIRIQMLECEREILGELVEVAATAELVGERYHEAGNIRALDALSEELEAEAARLQDLDGAGALDEARARLALLLGVRSDQLPVVATMLPDLPSDPSAGLDWQKSARENNVLARSALLAVEINRVRLRAARPLFFLNDAAGGVKADKDGAWSVGPLIDFSLPIFDLGSAQSGAAEARLRQSRFEGESVGLRVDGAIAQAERKLRNSFDRAKRRARMVGLFQKRVDYIELERNAMQVSVLESLRAKRAEREARIQANRALGTFWIDHTVAEELAAGGLPAALGPMATVTTQAVGEIP